MRFEDSLAEDPVFQNNDEHQDYSDSPVTEINLVLSEFARLLVLLRDNTNLRDDFLKSRTTLSRNELDSRVQFDACWSNTIAPAFNSKDYKPIEPYHQLISNIDTSFPPSEQRSGPYLRTMFYQVRAEFAQVYHSMNVSGEFDNDAQVFIGKLSKVPKCLTTVARKPSDIGKNVW